MHMPTKTISIKEEAYERLSARKRDDESFSDVILRLTKDDPNDFSNLIGADVDVSWEVVERDRNRSDADERREEVLLERRDE